MYLDNSKKIPEFLSNLYEILHNSEKYLNIISWIQENNKIIIIIKNRIAVSKILCQRSRDPDLIFQSCRRQFTSYSFYNIRLDNISSNARLSDPYSFDKKNNYVYLCNSNIEDISNILHLQKRKRKANIQMNKEELKFARILLDLSEVVVMKDSVVEEESQKQNENSVEKEVSINTSCIDVSTAINNNRDCDEFSSVLENQFEEKINHEWTTNESNKCSCKLNLQTNNVINIDKSIEDLIKENSNFIIDNENNIQICLLIESLKLYILNENEIEQINRKQEKCFNYLKNRNLNNDQCRNILFKYMLKYLNELTSIDKVKKGFEISNEMYKNIKKARIKILEKPNTCPIISDCVYDYKDYYLTRNKDYNLDKCITDSNQCIERSVNIQSEDNKINVNIHDAILRGQHLAQYDNNRVENSIKIQDIPWWEKGGTETTLYRLHSEPVIGHMIEVFCVTSPTYNGYWRLGRVICKRIYKIDPNPTLKNDIPWNQKNQIRTRIYYKNKTSVDELLHRSEWKKNNCSVNPDVNTIPLNYPKYWRYVK